MKYRSAFSLFLTPLILFFSIPFLVGPRVAGAQTDQDLGLKLVGTAVIDEPGKSIAIIEVQSTGMQSAFHEGYRWGNILIKEIQPGYVVIDTPKGEKILYMSSGRANTGRPPSSGDLAYLDRKEVDSTLPDYEELMQAVRVRPRFDGGEPVGFVIYRIEPGSIFARMGLKDGDVITAVNGKPVATTQQTKEFYDALKEGGTVALEIRRRERKMDLNFEIR